MFKIAITGPESTGKSSLSKALAEKLGCPWVPEYARVYLNQKLDADPNFQYQSVDIEKIARGQLLAEENILSTNKDSDFIIFDTEILVCKLWWEFKYKQACPEWMEDYFQSRDYDLFLLCDIDSEWEEDPLREHPYERKELFDLYHSHLEKANKNYMIVSGNLEERIHKILDKIQNK